MIPAIRRCDICLYWVVTVPGVVGVCHRIPPVGEGPGLLHLALYPKTSPSGWCGEFRRDLTKGVPA